MMIDPPIDKMIEMSPCRYALVTGLAVRAKEINAQEADDLDAKGEKALSRAAEEFYHGKMSIKIDN